MLFERSQQRIRLTRDGRTFLAETRAFLTHASRLESLARRLGRGDEGGLCIGYLEYAMHSGVLPDALRALRDGRPAVHLSLIHIYVMATPKVRQQLVDAGYEAIPGSVEKFGSFIAAEDKRLGAIVKSANMKAE